MSSRWNYAKLGWTITLLALLTTGCKIQGAIREGQTVAINNCKILEVEKVQSVFGTPTFEQLEVLYGVEGQEPVVFGKCRYGPLSPEEGYELEVSSVRETKGESYVRSFSRFKSLDGLGREAHYTYAKNRHHRDVLGLVFLADNGVTVNLDVNRPNTGERTLLAKARSLAAPALASVQKLFPGEDKPPRDEPPVPICSIVDPQTMIEVYRSVWAPPSGESVVLMESERFGGPGYAGAGLAGGGWICTADASDNVHNDDSFHPHTTWSISKVTPPADLPHGAVPFRGIGAAAYWTKERSKHWEFGNAGVLSVFTKGGKHFQIEVILDWEANIVGERPAKPELEEAVAKDLATRVAQRIVAKLP